ncbi:integrin alpha-9-like [Bacillus rossius redtenbacheri]|uniref:integrin alpha-9-like n=1 Tax=Bacillus rossius redtenbacheri TaxID=93214 RepID=UPI002FDCA1C2
MARLAVWLAVLARAAGFNLDTSHALLWTGQAGSHFGYTVALRDLGGDHRLVVGAPRGNSSYITHRRLTEPGTVFHCRLRDVTCEQLALDLSGNVNHTLPNTYFKYQDKKDNAWIGGSISVQQTPNSPMVVCAPRWKNSIEAGYYMMNGICYLSKAHSEPDAEARIIYPLSDPYLRAYPPKPVTNTIQRFYYAYGEAGLSTHFTKDGEDLLIGAPGVFDWAGTIVVYRNIKNGLKDVRIPNPFYTPSYQNPHDYFGYAVSSGVFFRRPREVSGTLYVSGAPRAGDLRGKVLVFGLPWREDRPLEVRAEKLGEQLGEYFGAALCVLDLDSDGLDDLLVGAPRHSLAGDEGRAYVFLSRDQGRLEEVTGNEKIVGDSEYGANFGTSIASIGDINVDGYPDVAIGAPYGGPDGSGSVFIYHGHRDGLKNKYSQRIVGSDINKAIRGFGNSISNGMDIDGNSYSDVAVGAHESDTAVVLRARPIVAVRAQLSTDVSTISINATSFQVQCCLGYSGQQVPPSLDLRYFLKVDPVFSRVYFPGKNGQNSNIYMADVVVLGNSSNCKNFSVNIKAGQKDFSKPIDVKLDYSLLDEVSMPTRISRGAYEDFCQDCPVVNPSDPNSALLRVPFATGCQQDDACRTDLKLRAKLVSAAAPLVLGRQSTVAVVVSLLGREDPAFLARVLLEAPAAASPARMPSSCRALEGPLLLVRCDVADPLRPGASPVNLTVELDLKEVPGNTTQLVFHVTATSTSQELRPEDNSQTLLLDVRTWSDLRMVGTPSQDTLYFTEASDTSINTDDELTCVHSYQVRNYGPSSVDSLDLIFRVPIAVIVGEENITFNRIYLPKASLNGQPVFCSAGDYQFPGDGANSSWGDPGRTRRAAGGEASSAGTLSLSCGEPHVACVTVTCGAVGPFLSAQASASVQLRMRVQPRRLLSILDQRKVVVLLTSGSISYQSQPNSLRPNEKRDLEATVATVLLAGTGGQGVNSWLLVLAVMGGLLLLLLLVLGLVKAGFFRRSKKEALEHLKTKMEYDDDEGGERETL